ncbi:MAG: ATP-binding protein [Verrucomicrobiales bacterium]|nr:ATP-binding protein [Verrucomicrobiales bacterium]MCP5526663.1 ATP-binding protein [Verrucomicrobiales bacterium]
MGEELISSEVVALIELVKNAYDADATNVLIRFAGPLEPGKGCIEVIDSGHGMELETVQTIWMEPATSSKRGKIRRTEKFKRRFLGEKGIGRFASSRLASELEVVSRREGTSVEAYGIFDWDQFDDESRYLDEVLILWEQRQPREIKPGGAIDLLWSAAEMPPPRAREKGTILRMTRLKQKWEASHFEALRRGLARLVSPSLTKTKDEDNDPGFEVEMALPPEFSQFSSKVEQPPILKHPHYVVRGSVQADGSFSITYRVLAEGLEKQSNGKFARVKDAKGRFELRDVKGAESIGGETPVETKPVECGPINLELRVWDRDELGNVVQKTHSTIKDIRSDLDSLAGINIYRDGFRVLPYGEPKDDWLRLDLRRVQNPTLRLSNNQLYGVVQISADTNPNLRDQSNREGLDENQALRDLRDVMTEVLSRLETMRYAARPRATGKSGRPVGGLFAGFDLKPLADYVAQHLPQDNQAKELVEKTEQLFGGQLKEIQSVLGRYQRLATLGQLIDHVLHEGRQPIASINSEAALGLEDVHRAERLGGEFVSKAAGRFTVIRKQGDVLAIAFRRMEPFGGRRRGRPKQLYLEEIIRDAFAVFADDIHRLHVRTTLPRSQTLVRLDPAEIQEVIINLLQNSIFWLEQVNEARREVAVGVERKGPEHVDILFSDSGPGVPPENHELIFEPYFSTKPEGVGLGLSIVGEIVSDYYEGSLELLKSGPLKGANFLVTLRKRV